MRKITLFFSLLLAVTAMAQTKKPSVSTEEKKTYYRFVSSSIDGAFIKAPITSNATTPFWSAPKNNEAGIPKDNAAIFTFEAIDDEEDCYYIYSEDYKAYMAYPESAQSTSNVIYNQTKEGGKTKWKVIPKTENEDETAVAIVAYDFKDNDPGSRLGLNPRGGGSGDIILFATSPSTNDASFWQIQKVGEATPTTFSPVSLEECFGENFTGGWFQIKTGTSFSNTPQDGCTDNDPAVGTYFSSISNNGSWMYSLTPMNISPTTFIYISDLEKTTENNETRYNCYFRNLDGNYATANSQIVSYTTPDKPEKLTLVQKTPTINPDGENADKAITIRGITTTTYTWGGWNSSGVLFVGYSSRDGANDCRFYLSPISDSYLEENYSYYTVTITGNPDGTTPTVTYADSDEDPFHPGFEKVYNGGTFFLPKDKTITTENLSVLSVTEITDYTSTISISEEEHSITINYEWQLEETVNRIATAFEEFKDASMNEKVGYPQKDKSEALSAALLEAQEAIQNKQDVENVENKVNALKEAYEAALNNIIIPKDGAVYIISARRMNGSQLYVIPSEDKYILSEERPTTKEGWWVSQQTTDYQNANNTFSRFIFAAARASQYLGWWQNTTINTKDYTPVSPIPWEINKGVNLGALGIFCRDAVSGGRLLTSATNVEGSKDINGNSSLFNQSSATVSESWTTDFVFEEVTVTDDDMFSTNLTYGRDADCNFGYYGTLNMPYAVVLPANVTAYTIQANDKNLSEIPLSLNDKHILPAETPVLLKKEAEGEAQESTIATIKLLPASAMTAAANTNDDNTNIQANELHGTLASKAVEGLAYIFAQPNGSGTEVMFYKLMQPTDEKPFANVVPANKAYYSKSENEGGSTANVQALALSSGRATGIDVAPTATESEAACYDLSGRRVTIPANGLYIIGGKKVFVK